MCIFKEISLYWLKIDRWKKLNFLLTESFEWSATMFNEFRLTEKIFLYILNLMELVGT